MTIQSQYPGLEVEDLDDVTLVTFTDKQILDEQRIDEIGESLFRLVQELKRYKIICNFSQVKNLSPLMLGKLVTLKKLVTAAKGKLLFCDMQPRTYEILVITMLNQFFEYYGLETLENAKAELDKLTHPQPNQGE